MKITYSLYNQSWCMVFHKLYAVRYTPIAITIPKIMNRFYCQQCSHRYTYNEVDQRRFQKFFTQSHFLSLIFSISYVFYVLKKSYLPTISDLRPDTAAKTSSF